MKTSTNRTDYGLMAENALLLPGYELVGDSVMPPCRLGPAFARFDGEWVIGPHGLACPECAATMRVSVGSESEEEFTDADRDAESMAELDAIDRHFTELRLMLRAIGTRLEDDLAALHRRFRRGQF